MRYTAYIQIFIVGFFLVSCGSKKNANTGNVTPNSKIDYAYIEKFHEGVRQKAKGETKAAITTFEECLSLRENDDAVYFALSELYLIEGNLEKSGNSIQKAAKLDPKNTHYISELAYYYVEQKKFDLAVTEFEKLIKIDPRNPEYLYAYAECLVRSGKIQESITVLTKIEDQMGIIPEITIQKFQLYQQIKQTEKGLAEIAKAQEMYPNDPQLLSSLVDYYLVNGQEEKAISTLETLAQMDDANGRVHLFLADMYRRKNQMDKFYASAKKAIAADGIELDQKTQFLASLQTGNKKVDPRAMELAEIFIVAHPKDAKPYSVMGDFQLSNGNEDLALQNYRKALQFEKGASSLWNQVLLMEYQANKYEELAIDSKESLQYFPTLPTLYLLNGVANIQLRNFDEAITNLEIGREYITNDNAIKAEFYGQLGEAFFGKKDFKKGISWYDKALSTDPMSSLLVNNYAYRLAASKVELSKAETLILKAIAQSPGQSNFIDTYGFVLFQQGKYTEALTQLEKAYGLDNDDKITAEHLGDVYIKLNKVTEAQKYWNKAKELGSSSKTIDKKIANSQYYEAEY